MTEKKENKKHKGNPFVGSKELDENGDRVKILLDKTKWYPEPDEIEDIKNNIMRGDHPNEMVLRSTKQMARNYPYFTHLLSTFADDKPVTTTHPIIKLHNLGAYVPERFSNFEEVVEEVNVLRELLTIVIKNAVTYDTQKAVIAGKNINTSKLRLVFGSDMYKKDEGDDEEEFIDNNNSNYVLPD